MSYLSCLLCVCLVALTYAHESCKECGNDNRVCAAEKVDPSNLVTFKNRAALDIYNRNHPNNEYEYLSGGKCKKQKSCPKVINKICAIPKKGVCAKVKTYDNLCALEQHNNKNPRAEYEYYHDEDCNDVTPAESKECDCLECDKKYEPVCAVQADCCGKPMTVGNYCLLQKINCESDKKWMYFHEGLCYTDVTDK